MQQRIEQKERNKLKHGTPKTYVENMRTQLLNFLLRLVARFCYYRFILVGSDLFLQSDFVALHFFVPTGSLCQFYSFLPFLVRLLEKYDFCNFTGPGFIWSTQLLSHDQNADAFPILAQIPNGAHARSISCSGQPFPVRIMPPSTTVVSTTWASDF